MTMKVTQLSALLGTCDDSIAKRALQWMLHGHTGRGRPKHMDRDLEKECGLQVQLEEDGGGRTEQSWMEISGLRPVSSRYLFYCLDGVYLS